MQTYYSIVLAFFCFLYCLPMNAQEVNLQVISSMGEVLENADVKMSYTTGETVISTLSSGNTTLTQGFQQAFFEVGNHVYQPFVDKVDINIYPNPFNSQLNVSISSDKIRMAEIQVYDMVGRLVYSQKTETGIVKEIDLNALAVAPYQIRILDMTKKLISSHTVIKADY